MAQQRVTYRYLCYSVLTSLKQVFTDQEITLEQMIFWVKCAVNKVKSKSLEKRPFTTGSYLSVFTDVPLLKQSTGVNNIIPNEKYFSLPANILDADLDRAIEFIAYACPSDEGTGWNWQPFERSTIPQIKLMQANPYEKPNASHPYFVRANKEIYLFGIRRMPVNSVMVGLYTSENPLIGDMNLDDEIVLNDEDVIDVINTVIMIGRFVLLIPKERIEEGSDTRMVPAYKQYSPTIEQQQQQVQNDQGQ